MSESGNVRKVKKRWGKVWEKTIIKRDALVKEDQAKDIEKDIKNSKVITPQSLAQKHSIRVSVAKQILRKFEEEGVIELKHKQGPHEIYQS